MALTECLPVHNGPGDTILRRGIQRIAGILPGAVLCLALVPAPALAVPARPAADLPPVAILVLDELSSGTIMTAQGEIDGRRFPNLAGLARTSTWYRNNTTVADSTRGAVPAILTGRRPEVGASPELEGSRSVFSMLRGRYRLRGYETVTDFCPDSWCPRPRQRRRLAGAWLDNRALKDVELGMVAGSLDQIRPGRRPLAWVTHVLLPHVPWRFLPGGDSYDDAGLPFPSLSVIGGGDYWTGDDYGIELSQQRALLQVAFVDRMVGEIRRRLERAGLWDKSMFVLVADHGSTFTPGAARRRLAPETFGEMAMVPLIVKYPRQAQGQTSDRSTNSAQVLPTVARWTASADSYQGKVLEEASWGEDVVTRAARRDENLTMPLSAVLAQRTAAIAERDRRLPGHSFYATPGGSSLVGRRLREAELSSRSPGFVRLTGRSASRAPGRHRGQLDGSYVTARVSGLSPGDRVAVVLGGKVVAVSEVFNAGRWPRAGVTSIRIAAMIPPGYLGKGNPDPSFYRVEGGRLSLLRSR